MIVQTLPFFFLFMPLHSYIIYLLTVLFFSVLKFYFLSCLVVATICLMIPFFFVKQNNISMLID